MRRATLVMPSLPFEHMIVSNRGTIITNYKNTKYIKVIPSVTNFRPDII
jgi:hypothetical protein